MGEVNSTDHPNMLQCSAGILWVLPIIWLAITFHNAFTRTTHLNFAVPADYTEATSDPESMS